MTTGLVPGSDVMVDVPGPRVEPTVRPALGRRGAVLRTRLIEVLSTVPRSVSVQAPAGWGKSTLLEQWARLPGRRVVTLAMTEADADPAILLGRLLRSLDAAAVPTRRLLAGPVA